MVCSSSFDRPIGDGFAHFNMGGKRIKITLKFDEEKRKDFLSGFSKRKEARKKYARNQMDKKLREERARIRKGKRDEITSRLKEIRDIKTENDCEVLDFDNEMNTTINLPNHDITIVESEAFSPFSNLFVGNNDNESEQQEEPSKFNAEKSAKTVERLVRKKQMLTNNSKKSSQGRASKKTKKFLRKSISNKGRRKK